MGFSIALLGGVLSCAAVAGGAALWAMLCRCAGVGAGFRSLSPRAATSLPARGAKKRFLLRHRTLPAGRVRPCCRFPACLRFRRAPISSRALASPMERVIARVLDRHDPSRQQAMRALLTASSLSSRQGHQRSPIRRFACACVSRTASFKPHVGDTLATCCSPCARRAQE